jgi:hypothetical protein
VEALEDRTVPSTFTVLNTADDGSVGSLRWAVGQANTHAGDDTINFDPGMFITPKTIALGGTQLELTDTSGTQTIMGPAAGVTVDAAGQSQVFQVDGLVNASISGLTITGGKDTNYYGFGGGGVYNKGTLSLTNCTVSGNSSFVGGGLSNYLGTLSLTNCTVSGNTGGGLVNFLGSMELTNCTVSGNSGGFDGGGVLNFGTLSLTNCTVSGNSASYGAGAGVYNYNYPSFSATLGNTIVAGNTAPSGGPDVAGPFTSQGHNLIGATDGSSGWVASDLTGNSARLLNPLLTPLDNFGGPTLTMDLLPGSPALDAGSNALIPAGVTTDQRGLPRIVNGTVDIGAFESEGFILQPVAGSTPQTATIGTAFAHPLAVTVKPNNMVEPVDGGVVRFASPPTPSGAAAFFSTPSAVISGGQASVTAYPNNADGSYVVIASAGGTASFSLTNVGPVFAHLAVNTTSDSPTPGAGLLSLREAVGFANADSTGHASITFDPTVFAHAQTINLSGVPLEFYNTSETETITGPTASLTIHSGGPSRVFQVDGGVAASLSRLTITGSGVDNSGTLALTNCTLSGNSASTGGGLFNAGTATLTNCTVSGNTAGNSGGGVNNGGTLALTNCTLSGNSAHAGGAVDNAGTATLTNCTLSGNTAFLGGGVANFGTLTLANCTVGSNSAGRTGGGLYSTGTATLTNCTVSGNSAFVGGGAGSYGALTLTNCTVRGNTSYIGGGVLDLIRSSLTMTNCTVSGNTATSVFEGGGGVCNFSYNMATLTNCVLSGNYASYGGAVYTSRSGQATLANCVVSGNTARCGGGGVFSDEDSTTTLTSCILSGNVALGGGRGGFNGGGAVQNSRRCTVVLMDCTITGNSARSNGTIRNLGGGGVLNAYGGHATLTDCTVSGNSSDTNGGGVTNRSGSTATLTNCTVIGNTATASGGGISNVGTLSVASSTINKNRAGLAGGGISTTAGSATIADAVINANQVNSSGTALGGGIDCEHSHLSLSNCTVNANQANGTTALGGGIYASKSTVDVQNSTVNGNKANGTVLGEGGGIYSVDTLLTLLGTTVKGNKATTDHDDLFGP